MAAEEKCQAYLDDLADIWHCQQPAGHYYPGPGGGNWDVPRERWHRVVEHKVTTDQLENLTGWADWAQGAVSHDKALRQQAVEAPLAKRIKESRRSEVELTPEEISSLMERNAKRASARDRQVGGDHYKDMPIQPGEFIRRNGLGWYEGNAIKYICRHGRKGGAQDLEKAIHYLQLALDEYRNEEKNDD